MKHFSIALIYATMMHFVLCGWQYGPEIPGIAVVSGFVAIIWISLVK